MVLCNNYYDVRYLLLPLVVLLKSYADGSTAITFTGGIFINQVRLVLVFGALAAFLLTSIRIQLFCCQPRRSFICDRVFELRFGSSALSVPVALSLTTSLFLPMSLFFYAYIGIVVMSFWSDSVDSIFTRFSHIEQCQLVWLPVAVAAAVAPPSSQQDGNLQQQLQQVPTLPFQQSTNELPLSIEEGVTLASR